MVKPLEPGLVCRNEAEQQVRVAGEIFGSGLDREVDAVGVRREEQRRRPGVVEDDAGAAGVRSLGDRRNILHFERLGTGNLVSTALVFGRISAAIPAPMVGS